MNLETEQFHKSVSLRFPTGQTQLSLAAAVSMVTV